VVEAVGSAEEAKVVAVARRVARVAAAAGGVAVKGEAEAGAATANPALR